MIELTPDQARCYLLGVFDMDDAEYFGYYDELFGLDFKKKEDAVYAVNKWLKPIVDKQAINRPIESGKIKEGLRRLIVLNQLPASRHDMPGWIDCSLEDFQDIHKKNFLLWLWETLYEEPFIPADLTQYRIRVDESFVKNPNNPELWGDPVYASEDVHDAEVRQGAPEDLPIKKPRDEDAKTGWLSRFFKNK